MGCTFYAGGLSNFFKMRTIFVARMLETVADPGSMARGARANCFFSPILPLFPLHILLSSSPFPILFVPLPSSFSLPLPISSSSLLLHSILMCVRRRRGAKALQSPPPPWIYHWSKTSSWWTPQVRVLDLSSFQPWLINIFSIKVWATTTLKDKNNPLVIAYMCFCTI